MLVLTRKAGQSIMIGDEIEVSVLAIMGEKVRIGIEAPREVPVFRKEVYLEIQEDRNGATARRYASTEVAWQQPAGGCADASSRRSSQASRT